MVVLLIKEVCDLIVLDICRSMYDVMLERDVMKYENGILFCDNLLFGSDYVLFYYFIGVFCVDWFYIFGGLYGIRWLYLVYYFIYDLFYWIKIFVDFEFKIYLVVIKYVGIFFFELVDVEFLFFNIIIYVELL